MTDIIMEFDNNILDYFSSHSFGEFPNILLKLLSWIGNYGLPWVIFAAVFLLNPKKRASGYILAFAMIAALIINNVLIKNIVARPRPLITDPSIVLLISVPSDFSFASGHAAASFAASVGISKANKYHALWSFPLAAAIAFSRIFFSAHYTSDVIAGSVIGLICGYLGIKIGPMLYNFTDKVIKKRKNQ